MGDAFLDMTEQNNTIKNHTQSMSLMDQKIAFTPQPTPDLHPESVAAAAELRKGSAQSRCSATSR